MTQSHILVVDDDRRLRSLLNRYLTENGFVVSETAQASEALDAMDLFSFDVIILDVMMPNKNGIDFAKELRDKGILTPILMLTAMGDSDSRIAGLENGADDYLAKPFEPRELVLRLKNILKRYGDTQDGKVYFGSCIYDSKNGQLMQNNMPVSLTTAEQDLLRVLVQKGGTVVSREELGGLLQTDNLRGIDVQITRLRKKLESDMKNPQCIQTVRGQGYLLAVK